MGALVRWELQDSAQETTDSDVLVQGPAGPTHPKGSHLGPYPKTLQFSFERFSHPTFYLNVCGSAITAAGFGVKHCPL